MKRREVLKAAGCTAVAAWVRALGAAQLNGLKIGVFSDEISNDLEAALRFLESYGLHYVELRRIWKTYIVEADEPTVQQVRDLLKKYKMSVPMIASNYLKSVFPGSTVLPSVRKSSQFQEFDRPHEEQAALLERSVARALDVGAPAIRVFSFWRTAEPAPLMRSIAEHLDQAAAIAARKKVKVALENEAACNVGTAAELGALFKLARHPNLHMVWDPGNGYMLGEKPYPDGFDFLPKDRICHIHLKDAAPNPKTGRPAWRPIGGGEIDFQGLIRAMLNSGYRGVFSLETHYTPKEGKEQGTRESLEGLLAIAKKL